MAKALIDFNSLNDDEKLTFNMFQMWFWGNLHTALILKEDNLIDTESFNIIASAFISGINTPGGQQWWDEAKKTPGISKTVMRFVEDELPITDSSWMDLEHMKSKGAKQ